MAERYSEYEANKRNRRMVDFDDLLALCHTTMMRDEKFAAAQRWRHRHLFVDEFQDVNPLQFALLKSWLGETSTLTVVGDPNQAIYGWNGADPGFIGEVDRHLPGSSIVHLHTNFRSTPEILNAAGGVLDHEPQPAVKPPGDTPTVSVLEGTEEATSVAQAVRARHRPGGSWNRQAVLARTNAQLLSIGRALERSGIPIRSRGDLALSRRPEITDLVEEWNTKSPLASVLADESAELEFAANGERGLMIETFLDLARSHLALDPSATVGDFISGLRTDDPGFRSGDAVDLATFHSAKGLEWPVVHIIGMEAGYVPIAFAHSREALEEERRLLYVAATRAESELHLYRCRRRARGDSLEERKPSPWLDAFISDEIGSDTPRPDIDAIRSELALDEVATDPPDLRIVTVSTRTLRRRLIEWRERLALASMVEPEAIIADEVLDRLVSNPPSDIESLRQPDLMGPGRARRWGQTVFELIHEPEA